MLLSYSTGSYVGYNLANKVSTTGDATISGNLDVGKVLTLKRIPGVYDTTPLVIINDSPGGATVATYTSTASNQGCVSFWTTIASTTPWVTGFMWGGPNEFIIKSGSNGLTLKPTGDAVIRGNLESQRLTINKPSNVYDIPLQIINNNQNWFVASLESTIAEGGCLMQWITPASSTYWWSGVWGTNTNGFKIWFNYKGL